jgi:putative sporulation protein YtaF
MLLSYLALAVSVSIDSLGIGITYGLRKTKISLIAKVILFIISITITTFSVYIGNIISYFLPSFITKLIGIILLICMGIWIIYEALHVKRKCDNNSTVENTRCNSIQKTYNIFIKSLGITIQIIRDPISSDIDGSRRIDAKEALYLGIALSIDSICVGIGSSIIGLSSFIFPIFIPLG